MSVRLTLHVVVAGGRVQFVKEAQLRSRRIPETQTSVAMSISNVQQYVVKKASVNKTSGQQAIIDLRGDKQAVLSDIRLVEGSSAVDRPLLKQSQSIDLPVCLPVCLAVSQCMKPHVR